MKKVMQYCLLVALAALFAGCASFKPTPEPEFPAGLAWLHYNVSAWPVTTKLDAQIADGKILVPFDKTGVWPTKPADGPVNANVWAIVNVKGQWYAATWEWLKPNVAWKTAACLTKTQGKGDHFKVAPLNKWAPKSGERIGFMVSGLARSQARNVSERSNVDWVVWP